MKTTTSNVKTEFLLGAGLDVLHFESKEWINTVAFWKDETKFFADLLKKKESADENKQEYGSMLKELDKIHADLYEDLAEDITNHEKFLARLEKGEKGLSDSDYRDKHRQIKFQMERFETDFQRFKRVIFQHMKNL